LAQQLLHAGAVIPPQDGDDRLIFSHRSYPVCQAWVMM
jgi:hypothetical protein